MAPGEIFLAQFPFGDAPGMKLRPVLILTNSLGPIPEVLVSYISSVIPSNQLAPIFCSIPLPLKIAQPDYGFLRSFDCTSSRRFINPAFKEDSDN
jgi:hypothetical protein